MKGILKVKKLKKWRLKRIKTLNYQWKFIQLAEQAPSWTNPFIKEALSFSKLLRSAV